MKHQTESKSNSTDTVCTVNGKRYYYDACDGKRDGIKAECFVYIGEGTIYSCQGVLQKPDKPHHFWRYNDRTLTDAK